MFDRIYISKFIDQPNDQSIWTQYYNQQQTQQFPYTGPAQPQQISTFVPQQQQQMFQPQAVQQQQPLGGIPTQQQALPQQALGIQSLGMQAQVQPQMQPQQPATAVTSAQPATVNPQTGQPDYSAQWIEYYRSIGMHDQAALIEQQIKQQPQGGQQPQMQQQAQVMGNPMLGQAQGQPQQQPVGGGQYFYSRQ